MINRMDTRSMMQCLLHCGRLLKEVRCQPEQISRRTIELDAGACKALLYSLTKCKAQLQCIADWR